MQDMIAVIGSSASTSGLIARTLRFRGIYAMPVDVENAFSQALAVHVKGVILALEEKHETLCHALCEAFLAKKIAVLALGQSATMLCLKYGGQVMTCAASAGAKGLMLSHPLLFDQMQSDQRMMNGFCGLTLCEGLVPIATAGDEVVGFASETLPLFGLQYHIERNDPDSAQMLRNFACNVCLCKTEWNEDVMIDRAVERIRASAPTGQVLCAVSGGVDSAVCAKLAHMAVGDRLICVFVDTGLLRHNEPDEVIATYMNMLGIVVAYEDAKEIFARALSGIPNTRDKERISSSLMKQILLKQLTYAPDIKLITFGTILNDALDGFGLSATSMTESNEYEVSVCEPIHDLFKDEVRRIAEMIGLPPCIAKRQPFPSSGLALRIVGEINEERLHVLRKADEYVQAEIKESGYDKRLRQCYATLMPNPMDQTRYIITIRALQNTHMNACAARLPFDLLERITQAITSDCKSVSQVVYDLTPNRVGMEDV